MTRLRLPQLHRAALGVHLDPDRRGGRRMVHEDRRGEDDLLPGRVQRHRPYLGWQGQIPKRAAKMAGIAIDSITSTVLKPEELFARIDPDELAKELEGPLHDAINDIVEEIMTEYQPRLWAAMPAAAKRAVVANVERRAPAATRNMMSELRKNLDQVFDLKYMVVSNLVRDKRVLNRMFQEAGADAFQVPHQVRPVLRLLHRTGSGDRVRDHRGAPRAATVRADHGRADGLHRAEDDLPPQGTEADRTGNQVARPVPQPAREGDPRLRRAAGQGHHHPRRDHGQPAHRADVGQVLRDHPG